MRNKQLCSLFKKAFACALSAAMIMGSAAMPIFAASKDKKVGDVSTQSNFGQDPSTDLIDMSDKNPIEVNNKNISEILHQPLANTNGRYYQLTEDIELSGWQTAEYFGGTLDGNGHTITLKDNSSCFIHYLNTKGTLQNIGFLGEVTTSIGNLGTSGDACVVATCQGNVLNCYMKMKYGSTSNYASGFIGQTQAQAIVSNCAVQATGGNTKFYPLAQEAVNASKIFNSYWDSTSRDDTSKWADYRGIRSVTDRADVYDCSQQTNEDMLKLLNTYKGANSVEWTAGEDGFPILKKPEVKDKYTVSFTKADGTKIENVQKNGFSLKLQDVPASHNAGTLELKGFDGKVAWLLSQYDDGKQSYEWKNNGKNDSNIWPSIYSGALAVKGTGEATIVAWDESTLSHTVDKQDVPKEDSVELARFKVTVTAGKITAIRLVANGEEIKDNKLTIQGSEWTTFQPQTKEEGSDEWKNVPVSSVKFPESTDDTYQAFVTNKEAKYRAKKPGSFELKVTGFDKDYTVNVTSEYVPVKSIKPAFSGTVNVYPSNYQGSGSQHNLGIALTSGTLNQNVIVEPSNASYAYNYTMDSSDNSIAEYTYDKGGTTGIVPKKSGEVTLTATSADPNLKKQVSGSTTIKFVYANEVAAKEFLALAKKLPASEKVTKEDETLIKDLRFIYDNLSFDDKIAVGNEIPEQLTKCEAKLAEIKKAEQQQPITSTEDKTTTKPTVKPAITLNYKKIRIAVKQKTSVVKIKKSAIKGDKIKSAKSSNKKVAKVTVKKGKLTIRGLKKGTTVVTVTSKNGAKAKVKVTVQKKPVALKKLIRVTPKKQTVKKGEKIILKVSKLPVTAVGTVKWTTSNKKVATVSKKGIVKGIKKGNTTITAKVGKKSLKFNITVK